MPRDVVVYISTDAKRRPKDSMDMLLINTEGAKDFKDYRSIEEVEEDYADTTRTYEQAKAIFDQVNSLSGYMTSKIYIVGIAAPTAEADMLTALETLKANNEGWYCFATDQETPSYITAMAAWAASTEPTLAQLRNGVEDQRKMYFYQSDDLAFVQTVKDERTVSCFCDPAVLDEEIACSYYGNVAPFYPESATWKFKSPDGVTPTTISRENKDRLEEANVNFMTEENKKEYMKNGTCADGEFIDVVLGKDYITQLIRGYFYDLLTSVKKIPYTDQGFTMVAQCVQKAIFKATDLGIVARDPSTGLPVWNMEIPTRAGATDDQARERAMPPIYWRAQLEGAVHSVETQGVLAATL